MGQKQGDALSLLCLEHLFEFRDDSRCEMRFCTRLTNWWRIWNPCGQGQHQSSAKQRQEMARIRRWEDLVGNIASIECMQLGDATFCDSCPFYVPLTLFSQSPLLALLCLTAQFPICFCSLNLSKHPFMQKTLSMHVYAYLCQVWNFRHQLYTKHETGHW